MKICIVLSPRATGVGDGPTDTYINMVFGTPEDVQLRNDFHRQKVNANYLTCFRLIDNKTATIYEGLIRTPCIPRTEPTHLRNLQFLYF